ncbi:ATP-NAD kinase-like domain-containing protein [Crucibulum laeve]|uniref:ATP-NAD kinase-like domain-containing protein n=1 Tax=Crucibulum laeve TaxID=68775 RepID=A0A5C3MKW0_9AGAR|nr:ATP-NAD kinase-like domain-containing protein [Crucibulum laeve]
MDSTQPVHNGQLAVNSPCFVHSHLDKGASLNDWLRNKHQADNTDVGVAKSLQRLTGGRVHNHQPPYSPFSTASNSTNSVIDSDGEEEFVGSLTKQLAETAVGVREMSKQLGRARVQSNIQNVLIITKARDNRLIKLTRELALYLMLKQRPGQKRGLVVYVDNQLRHSKRFDAEGIERDHPELFVPFPRRRTSSSHSLSSASSSSGHKDDLIDEGQLRYWTSSMCSNSPHLFDFVVTLGGDGTVLFTSWLFQRIVPPVLPFALGSLGFLTNFDFSDHQAVMDSAIENGIRVNLRMRFTCTVFRAVANEEGKGRKAVKKGETGEIIMKNIEKGGWEALEGGWSGGYALAEGKCTKDKEIMCFTTRPVETFEVLNDLVVDRGPSPYVSQLELFGDDHHMTTVQADGLTVSTPTGSTAYSLSAGGSLVHPEIPALLITPICPHTLSFRPMLLPDSMELRICVPYNSRSTAWASFDGRGRIELKQGDHIKVTASKYPFPTVCADKQSTDWFHAISRTLKWNERERQKSFVVVEEGPSKPKKRSKRGTPTPEQSKVTNPDFDEMPDDEEDEVSEDEEEDDKFDIDDSSPEAASAAAGIQTGRDASVDEDKVKTPEIPTKSVAATLLRKERRRTSKSRSRSRSSGVRSGVDSPSRFQDPHPHPPNLSPRHVGFSLTSSSPTSQSELSDSGLLHVAQQGARDDIHSNKQHSGRSRIPKDRDIEAETVKTPTLANLTYGKGRGHSRTRSSEHHRAFAVWGQDESDSNASDSDA